MKSLLKSLVIILLSLSTINVMAQQPTDCSDAVIICGNSSVNLNVNGIGTQELNGNNACGQESNSVWLQVTLVTNGTLGFTLTPNSSAITEDYDFYIFGPNVPCNNLGQAIRCSTTNPQNAGLATNLTGMNATETDVSEGPGADGNSFVKWLDVLAGETYFIVIDRPVGNSPFSLEWTGTAQFSDPPVNQSATIDANNLESCDVVAPNDDGFTTFNLEDNTSSIIGTQTNVAVTYHLNASDANLNINPLASPYTNITNPQSISVRITNTVTGCFEISDFLLTVNPGPDFTPPTDFVQCDNSDDGDATNGQVFFDLDSKNPEILNGQDPASVTISYHETSTDAEQNINPLASPYYNTTPYNETVFVRIEDIANLGCRSITTLNLVVEQLPTANNTTLTQCDEDGIPEGFTTFNFNQVEDAITGGLPDSTVAYYLSINDANNATNEIDGNAFHNFFNPQIVYAKVTNTVTGCYNIAELTLQVSLTSANDTTLKVCDDDGTEDGFYSFNLSDADTAVLNGLPAGLDLNYYVTYDDALLEQNPLPNTFTNTTAYSQIVYARVENSNACFGISQLQLTVFKLPNIETEAETIYCLNFFPEAITLTGGVIGDSPSNYYYTWSTGEDTSEIMINAPGTYTVRVTNTNGCFKDRIITVLPSNIASITSIDVEDASQNNSISVFVTGEGDYEYALDDANGPYQDSNTFENVTPGLHTIYVRDKNDCGVIDSLVSVIGFPKYFTPNDDSYHDFWQVYGITEQFQPKTTIYIFDRQGKLIKELDPLSAGWDGTLNGYKLPASDYWFSVKLQDGRTFKNHFTLKR